MAEFLKYLKTVCFGCCLNEGTPIKKNSIFHNFSYKADYYSSLHDENSKFVALLGFMGIFMTDLWLFVFLHFL